MHHNTFMIMLKLSSHSFSSWAWIRHLMLTMHILLLLRQYIKMKQLINVWDLNQVFLVGGTFHILSLFPTLPSPPSPDVLSHYPDNIIVLSSHRLKKILVEMKWFSWENQHIDQVSPFHKTHILKRLILITFNCLNSHLSIKLHMFLCILHEFHSVCKASSLHH